MSSTLDLLRGAVRAVTVHLPSSFAWFGREVAVLPEAVSKAMTPSTGRDYLRYRLQWQLYQGFYCRGFAAPSIGPDDVALPRTSSFVEALSAANCGIGPFEPGWTVEATEGDRVVVDRDGLRLWVTPTQVTTASGVALTLGAAVSVRFPQELRKLLPGYYMALGNCALPERGEPLVRFYWNLTPEGAPLLVRSITDQLNRAELAFRLKVVDNERAFDRCDAGVLYVRRADYAEVARLVRGAYDELCRLLKPATPALTKLLAPGLGLAEDPGTGESFGFNRCGLIAEGMILAAEAGAMDVEDRLAAVSGRLGAAGVRVEEPFLNPGSSDDYLWANPNERQDVGPRR